MSLCILGEYGKILLTFSHATLPLITHIFVLICWQGPSGSCCYILWFHRQNLSTCRFSLPFYVIFSYKGVLMVFIHNSYQNFNKISFKFSRKENFANIRHTSYQFRERLPVNFRKYFACRS
jgi:hypothetical protein